MPETYIARSSAIAARMLAGEMMVMNLKNSTFYALNPAATVIWQAADGRTPLSEIVKERICGEFEITPEQAQKDAAEFVADLCEHGILQMSDSPVTGGAEER